MTISFFPPFFGSGFQALGSGAGPRRQTPDAGPRAAPDAGPCAAPFTGASLPEQPEQNGQKHADQQAGDNGEMKAEVSLAVIVNVSRQPAQPAFAEPRPQHQTDACDNQAANKNEFAQIVHLLARESNFVNGYFPALGDVWRPTDAGSGAAPAGVPPCSERC